MIVRIILVLLIILAVGTPFALPYLPFFDVEEPDIAVEKPPFEQSNESALFEVGTQRFGAFDYSSVIEVTGSTSADKTRVIRSEVSGEVEVVDVSRGDRVSIGQRLIKVAAETRQSQVAQAEANVENARVDLDATRKLVESGVYSQNRLTAADAAYQGAVAALDQATQQIDNLDVVSAVEGLVLSVEVEEGGNVSIGEGVATVIALDPIKVVARVSEDEIGNVRQGQTIKANLVTGQTFEATVTYIAPSASLNTRTFEIEAEAANPNFEIRDGVTASVMIERPVLEAFEITQSAMVTNEEGRLGVRTVDANSTVQFNPIELLETTLDTAWVTGLGADMDVIVVGQRFAEVGDKVVATDIAEVTGAEEAVNSVLDGQNDE